MIQLRDYQEHAIDALWEYFHSGKKGNPLVLMPTGTGKSLGIAGFVCRSLREYPQTRVLKLTHVETLIEQNAEKLLALWPQAPLGIHSAALGRRDVHHQIIYGGIQSLYRQGDTFPVPHLIVVDEAHLIGPNDETMYQTFFAALRRRNPALRIVGFTATDWRMGSGRLTEGNVFTDVAIDMTTPEAWNWFVDNGYLAPLYSKRTDLRVSEEGIRRTLGEFDLSAQQKVWTREEVTEQAITEMHAKAADRHCWLVFATGVSHCDQVAEMLNSIGIRACSIHSKTKNADKLLAEYKAGEYRAAVSMNKLTTGVDVPQIDCIGALRFTDSSGLWVQLLGRGTRPLYAKGYDLSVREERLAAMQASAKPHGCLVLDFAHNTERLGPINNPVIKEPRKKGQRAGAQVCPVRVCPQCAEYVHASKRFCPCGYEFALAVRIDGVASNAEVMTRGEETASPVVERIAVHTVTYRVFRRRNSDRPPALRVTYYAEGLLRRFEEYICFEHEGAMQTRARNWWRERTSLPIPGTCAEAEANAPMLATPHHIKVWINIPKPKVMSHEFV